MVAVITSDINEYSDIRSEVGHGEREKVICLVKEAIKNFDLSCILKFNDEYFLGKVINILSTNSGTEMFTSSLLSFAGNFWHLNT